MNYGELAIAIERTHRELADAKGDDVRACLYYHLDKLLDVELAYFGAGGAVAETGNPATESEEEEAPPSDEEKIAEAVAAGKVSIVPEKRTRKKSNISPQRRWEQSERIRKMTLRDRYVPISFKDSKFYSAEAASESAETLEATTARTPYRPNFNAPEPIETDDGEPIQIGGIELRP